MKKLILMMVMMLLAMPIGFGEEEVIVTLPDFDVILNGQVIDNVTEQYPFISYKGITYIPMTWDLSHALGLKTQWSQEDGLSIMKAEKSAYYVQKGKSVNVLGKSYKAKLVDFPVKVNGQVIDNSNEEYPILNFKNIAYFPMTYDYMVKAFNSGYQWHDETGLSVTVDASLEMTYPKVETYEFTMTMEEFGKSNLFVRDRCKLVHEEDASNGFFYVNYMIEDYDDSILDVSVDYFGKDDRYMFTEKVITGLDYVYDHEGLNPYLNGHPFMFPNDAESFMIRMTYTPEVTLFRELESELESRGVEVKIVNSEDISMSYLKSLGSYFFSEREQMLDYGTDPSDDLLKYAAYKSEAEITYNDTPMRKTYLDENRIKLESLSEGFSKLSQYTEVVINKEEENYLALEVYAGHIKEFLGYSHFIYVYDKNKKLNTVVVIKDMILKGRMGVE